MFDRIVLTCEHGGSRIPRRYLPHFAGAERLLGSHRGLDIGALALARRLSRATGAPLLAATVSRLVVDLNRSARHPRCFSEITRRLGDDEKSRLLRSYHRPHRDKVRRFIGGHVRAGRTVLHLGVHSFTPVFRGRRRAVDIGLLYDPSRHRERELARLWKDLLEKSLPGFTIRRNSPYRGDADGLTTTLRGEFPARRYLGLEIEVNQRDLSGRPDRARRIARAVAHSLALLASPPGGRQSGSNR